MENSKSAMEFLLSAQSIFLCTIFLVAEGPTETTPVVFDTFAFRVKGMQNNPLGPVVLQKSYSFLKTYPCPFR